MRDAVWHEEIVRHVAKELLAAVDEVWPRAPVVVAEVDERRLRNQLALGRREAAQRGQYRVRISGP